MHEDNPGIGPVLSVMLKEGERGNAPVFRIRDITQTPFRLLIFTILSSRTKDERTIEAAKRIFSLADIPKELAAIEPSIIEEEIRGVGFYRQKAQYIKAASKWITDNGGSVPENLKDLIGLPGVGRKTANIVLAGSFGKNAIGVDTHVHRISNRLGIVNSSNPKETEEQLRKNIPCRYWKRINISMVAYGQTICLPKKPKCSECKLRGHCLKRGVLNP